MNGADTIRRLHRHRAWVNRKLLDAAAALPAADLQKQFPIGQGSIWKSLVHLHAAEFVWLESLLGNEEPLLKGDLPGKIPGNQQGEGAIGSLDELKAKWHELEARWQTYLESLEDADLDQVVYKVSSQGKRHGTRRGDILLHVCTHAQYTTAQVVNMLRHAGAPQLPDPMLITMARQESAAPRD
jgi:uncharacterized damage-inducible protein DinB